MNRGKKAFATSKSIVLTTWIKGRFSRFLVAGAINTLFGFVVYCAALFAGLPIWSALLIGTVGGMLFNFLTTAGYVFRQLNFSRFPKFVLCYSLVYAINLGLIKVLMLWLHNEKLAQLLLIFPLAGFSYLLMSRLVFLEPEGNECSIGRDHDKQEAP